MFNQGEGIIIKSYHEYQLNSSLLLPAVIFNHHKGKHEYNEEAIE